MERRVSLAMPSGQQIPAIAQVAGRHPPPSPDRTAYDDAADRPRATAELIDLYA
jgi:hypothetical protein